MRDRLKTNCKILWCKICVAWFGFLIYVALPLLKYIGYFVIFVTIPLWFPIYWLVKDKEIKERENNADR